MSTAAPADALPQSGNGQPALLDRLRAQPRLPLIIGGEALVAAAAAFMLWSHGPQ